MSENNGNKKKKFSDTFAAGGTDEEKKKRHEAGGIIATLGFLIGGIFQVGWMAVTPRLLGEVDMGLFSPIMFAFYGVSTLIALGIPQTITTFVSNHYEHDMEEAVKFMTDGIRLLLTVTLGTSLVCSSVAVILGLTGVLAWMWVAMIVVFSMGTVMAALFWGTNCILNGIQRIDLLTIGNIVFPIGIFAISTGLILLAQKTMGAESRWDVVGAVAALGLGHIIAFLVSVIVVKRANVVDVKSLFGFRSKHGLYGKILRFGGLTAVAFVCMTLIQNITTLVVRIVGMKWMLFQATHDKAEFMTKAESCEAAIGHFGTALIYGSACMLITGIGIASISAMSEAENQGRKDLMQHYYNTALSQSMFIIGIFVALFSVLIGPMAEIMNGENFPADVMHPLGVLGTIGGAGTALLFVLIHIFTGLKKPIIPGVILPVVIVTMIAGIGGFSYYMKDIHYPMIGYIAPTWLGCVACFIMAKKSFGLKFPAYAFYEPLIAAVPPILFAIYVMPKPTLPDNLWVVGADIPIIVGPYILITWLFDKMRKKERLHCRESCIANPQITGGTHERQKNNSHRSLHSHRAQRGGRTFSRENQTTDAPRGCGTPGRFRRGSR